MNRIFQELYNSSPREIVNWVLVLAFAISLMSPSAVGAENAIEKMTIIHLQHEKDIEEENSRSLSSPEAYQQAGNCVVVNTITAPGESCGLAWDKGNLWASIHGNAPNYPGVIFKIDTVGNILSSFGAPGQSSQGPHPEGLAFDGTYLWSVDFLDNKIYKLSKSGAVIGSIPAPYGIPSGLAWDGTNLWVSEWFSYRIYKLNPDNGQIVMSFNAPDFEEEYPYGLAWDGTHLWASNSNGIYKLDPITGAVLASCNDSALKYGKAYGMTWDGQYLWGGGWISDSIIKIDVPGRPTETEKIGVFRDGTWSLDVDGNGVWNGCSTDSCLGFGITGDTPIVGDWNGDGKKKVGVKRGLNWYLDYNGNGIWDGCGTTPDKDRCYTFGFATDTPVVGDWNNSGVDKIGVFRDGTWSLDVDGNGVWNGYSTDSYFGFGITGDTPIVGDWNGDGKKKMGVKRGVNWYLDYNGNETWDGCSTDRCYTFGLATDMPVVGDWNGDGISDIGVKTGTSWFLDYNGSGSWDDCSTDRCYSFGLASDKPVCGNWSNSVDYSSPSVPTGLTATAGSSSQINLSWTASTDNVGVTGYKIYRNGTYLKSVSTTSTSDTGLNSSTRYCYTVSAFDAAGNVSAQSGQACATTNQVGPVDVVGSWAGNIRVSGHDELFTLIFFDDSTVGHWVVGAFGGIYFVYKSFMGTNYSVSGNVVTFSAEEQPGSCNAQWNGTGTVSGNYMSGTFSGSDCTLSISNAPFSATRVQ